MSKPPTVKVASKPQNTYIDPYNIICSCYIQEVQFIIYRLFLGVNMSKKTGRGCFVNFKWKKKSQPAELGFFLEERISIKWLIIKSEPV